MRISFDHVVTKNRKCRPLIRKRIRIGQHTPWDETRIRAPRKLVSGFACRTCAVVFTLMRTYESHLTRVPGPSGATSKGPSTVSASDGTARGESSTPPPYHST